MVYIAGGRGIYEGDGLEPVAIGAGTLMMHFPEVWHRYKPSPGNGLGGILGGFRRTFCRIPDGTRIVSTHKNR